MHLIAPIICCLLLIMPAAAVADIIHFKDGMKTVCQGRAWEDNDQVKCEYGGVVLSYPKTDVEHIQKTFLTEPTAEPPPADPDTTETRPAEAPALQPALNSGATGPAFYSPRRPYKYWSSPSARHHTYREAIDALAREFGKSSQWIEAHIGQTNNLNQIRQNLATPTAPNESATAAPSPAVDSTGGVAFYNPRREFKYQISATQKYHTYQEAIEALAQEFGCTPKWIEDNLGENNDMMAIRENLSRQTLETAGPHRQNLNDY